MGEAAKKIVDMSSEEELNKISRDSTNLIEDVERLHKVMVDECGEKVTLSVICSTDFKSKDVVGIAQHINANRSEILISLRSITENVIKTVKSMTESSKTLDEIHGETTQLADYSSTIASAGEELSATINSISQNIQNTVQASGEAKSLASSGNTVVNNTLTKIEEVSSVLTHTNSSLTRLKETAEQANTIIKVVNDISSKTDLLALNASIEAARAGAAGRGFAVVAHEVGRLSEKTQASINEIETILNNIQKDVEAVSNDLKTGTNSSNEAVTEVIAAKDTIDQIAQKIDHVDNEVSNISSAINEQAQAVTDIANNVSTISEGSKQVNGKVQQVSDLIDNVAKGSNSSRNLLGQFKMGQKSLLLQSQVDHLFWMHRLRRMLEGKENIQQEEFVDHTKCRLGKWYLSISISEHSDSFRNFYGQLDGPHARLHSVAANVIRFYNSGDSDEAFKKYEECLPISVEIVSLLEKMLHEVGS